MQRHALFDRGEAPDQRLFGWATVGVGLGYIDKVPLAEQAFGLVVRGLRPGNVGGDAGLCARHDFLAAEVPPIGDDLQVLGLHGGACALRHHRQLAAITAFVGDLVVEDQVMLSIHRCLHVVANDTGAAGHH